MFLIKTQVSDTGPLGILFHCTCCMTCTCMWIQVWKKLSQIYEMTLPESASFYNLNFISSQGKNGQIQLNIDY